MSSSRNSPSPSARPSGTAAGKSASTSASAGKQTPSSSPAPVATGRIADTLDELAIPSPSPPVERGSRVSSLDTTSSSASGGSGGNPLRSLNPAFSLSPRADSDTEMLEAASPSLAASRVTLELGPEGSIETWVCDLATLEERRLFVSEKCVSLARRMTPTRIVEQLLPALLTAFECDDYSESFDDCTPCIARALPDIIAALGRPVSTHHFTCFMGLIMELCCCAESTVTVDITASLQQLLRALDDDIIIALLLPLVMNMRVSFWSTPRAVAAGLLGELASNDAVVAASGITVQEWFRFYLESSRDASVFVREAAVASLYQWVALGQRSAQLEVGVPLKLVAEFITDDLSDTVRYTLVEQLLPLASIIGKEAATRHLLGTYVAACTDPSWRVRYVAATHLGEFAKRLTQPQQMMHTLMQLAEDEEPEVRSAVARQLGVIAGCLSPELLERHCVPVALHLSEDPNPSVRRSAVQHFYPFLLLEHEDTAAAVCGGIVQRMDDPNFTVQVSAIRSLETLIATLYRKPRRTAASGVASHSSSDDDGDDGNNSSSAGLASSSPTSVVSRRSVRGFSSQERKSDGSPRRRSPPPLYSKLDATVQRQRADMVVTALVQHLQIMSDAGNWRLRDAVVHAVPHFCLALPAEQFAPLTLITRTLLRDPVSEVRSGAVAALEAIAGHYGGAWAAQTASELMQMEFSPGQQTSYVWRVIAIQCLSALLPRVSELPLDDVRRQRLLVLTTELLQQYVRDPVPNVRIALAKSLVPLHRWFAASPREQAAFNDAVVDLQQDKDHDVATAVAGVTKISRAELQDQRLGKGHDSDGERHSVTPF